MFAERFKVTDKVGLYKAENQLPAKDIEREQSQFIRITELAENYGLDPEFAEEFLKTVIEKVVANHVEIASDYSANTQK